MPELPEVETIRRGLSEVLIHAKISEVEVFCEKSMIGPREVMVGAEILEIGRRGKCLLVKLSSGVTVMIHLRMTGQLIYRGREEFAGGHPSENFVAELPNKQTRILVKFMDGGVLYFNDQRKFGFFKIVPTEEVERDSFISRLAPEPWEMGEGEFYERLSRHKGVCIKAVILDQHVICGLGNIYADEALYMAGIDPRRVCAEVSKEEAGKLLLAARDVMEKSINSGGSTMATYVKADGTRGDYLELFAQVFRREGKECARCGAEIVKIRVAGRGTHICPECQK